jgi:drug/metabolite transporter (DMT)-like permease
MRWTGTLVSLGGIYLVVGHGARQGESSLAGDGMIAAAMLCWAAYTVGTKPLLTRYSPVFITGLTMAIGTAVYAPLALLWLEGVYLPGISAAAWLGIVYSAVFSLVAAYVIWYTAVQKLGGGRTSMYSNVVPMVAMAVAAVALGEAVTATKVVGALAVLSGVALTRLERPRMPA